MNSPSIPLDRPLSRVLQLGLIVTVAPFLSFIIFWKPVLAPAAIIFLAVAVFIAVDYRRGILLALFFSPLVSTGIIKVGFNLTITQILLLMTVSLFIAHIVLYHDSLQRSPIDTPFIILGFVILITSLIAYPSIPAVTGIVGATGLNSPETRSFVHLFFLALLFGFYFLIVQYGSCYARVNQLLNTYFVSSSLVALYGIYQFVGSYLGFPFTDINQMRAEEAFVGSFKRIDSTFPEPSLLSAFLMVSLILLIALLSQKRFCKSIIIPAIIIHAMALWMSFARTGWITFVVALGFLLIISYKSSGATRLFLRLGVLGIVFYFFLGAVLSIFPSDVVNTSYTSANDRLYKITTEDENQRFGYYEAAINMFNEKPLTGVGFENYTFYYDSRKPSWAPYFPSISDAKNLYLQIMAESGLMGVAAFMLWAMAYTITIIKTLRRVKTPAVRCLANGCAAASLGLALAFFNMQNFYVPFIWFLLALTMISFHLATKESRGEKIY